MLLYVTVIVIYNYIGLMRIKIRRAFDKKNAKASRISQLSVLCQGRGMHMPHDKENQGAENLHLEILNIENRAQLIT